MVNFLRAWKFEAGFLLIVGAALLVWAGTVYLSPEARQERDANKYLEELQAQYKNDTYGGTTPEETLALFIAALEKGDIELASKYALPEDRDSIQQDLNKANGNGGMVPVISRLRKLELLEKDTGTAFFVLKDGSGNISSQVVLNKNLNNVWKVTDF